MLENKFNKKFYSSLDRSENTHEASIDIKVIF